MRIAVSGAHATGKSTLIAELARRLPQYQVIDELYYDLDAGNSVPENPGPADFAFLCDRSLAQLRENPGSDLLFDRCPVDYLAYLSVTSERGLEPASEWVTPVAQSLAPLDLIVFVPIEEPDRIHCPAAERPRLRARVDRVLREMLMEDAWGLELPAVEVSGGIPEQVESVLSEVSHRSVCS